MARRGSCGGGRRGVAACMVALALLVAGCAASGLPGSSGAGGATAAPGNGVLGWPFDTSRGRWAIENGYNWGPDQHGDHVGYELYSFDFWRTDGATTEGEPILSPVTGTAIDFGSAAPGDYSSGHCARVSIDGAVYAAIYVMLCHLDHVRIGHVARGDVLGAVAGGPKGDHIHITLYKLINPALRDTPPNVANRRAVPFSDPWIIAGCSYAYRTGGGPNQWRATRVPCGAAGRGGATPPPTVPPATIAAGVWGFETPDLSSPGGGLAQLTQRGATVMGVYTLTTPEPCAGVQGTLTGSVTGNGVTLRATTMIAPGGEDACPFVGTFAFTFSGTVTDATDMRGTVTIVNVATGQRQTHTWFAMKRP